MHLFFWKFFVCFLLRAEAVFRSNFMIFCEISIQNFIKRVSEVIKALSLASKQYK